MFSSDCGNLVRVFKTKPVAACITYGIEITTRHDGVAEEPRKPDRFPFSRHAVRVISRRCFIHTEARAYLYSPPFSSAR